MAITYSSGDAIDIPSASYAAIKARFRELAAVVDAVSTERQALIAEINHRESETKLLLRIDRMSKSERETVKEIVNSDEFLRV
jgi:hypothetical protein